MPTKRHLTLTELQEVLHLKPARIYALVAEGVIPAPIKVGTGKNLWLASEVDAYLDARASARPRASSSKPSSEGGVAHTRIRIQIEATYESDIAALAAWVHEGAKLAEVVVHLADPGVKTQLADQLRADGIKVQTPSAQ